MLKIIGKLLFTVVGLGLIVGALVGTFASMIGTLIAAGESMQPPPSTVATSAVSKFEWKRESKAVGTIEAVQGVTLSNELAGLVSKIHFKSGESIQAGDPLVELNKETEEAQLAAAKATENLAKLNLKRARQLYKKDTISKAELDLAIAESSNAEAQVANLEAIIARRTIYAPFDGKLGIRQIDLGEYLNPGAPIVTLQSQDPVYATFYLPQRELAHLETGLKVIANSDAAPDEAFIGEITAIESQVDVASRNIRIQATLQNPDGQLKPGMFINVLVEHAKAREVFAIPTTAVAYASYGNRVFTAVAAEEGEGLVASEHFVKLGETRGDYVEILDGIEKDAEVVTEGAFKLYTGAPIATNNELTPATTLDPDLKDS